MVRAAIAKDDRFHKRRPTEIVHVIERGLCRDQELHHLDMPKMSSRNQGSAVVTACDIPRGCAATYFPEANVLVPVDQVAEKSNTPASKSVVISIRPSVD